MKAIKTEANGPTTIELYAAERNAMPVLTFIGKCADGEFGDAAQTAANELSKVLEHLDAVHVGAPAE